MIEKVAKDGKTYYKINDYNKLQDLFGELLAEVQRIKSEGDYEAGKKLVETYGVQVDPVLHKEVKERFGKLNIAPYGGFINPEFLITKVEKPLLTFKLNTRMTILNRCCIIQRIILSCRAI